MEKSVVWLCSRPNSWGIVPEKPPVFQSIKLCYWGRPWPGTDHWQTDGPALWELQDFMEEISSDKDDEKKTEEHSLQMRLGRCVKYTVQHFVEKHHLNNAAAVPSDEYS